MRVLAYRASKGYLLPAELRQGYFEALYEKHKQHVGRYLPAFEEPLFLDDGKKQTADLLWEMATGHDVFVCLEGEKVVGFASLHSFSASRHAELLGYVSPEYRKTLGRKTARFVMQDLLPYAWNELRLIKLKASVSERNTGAIRFLTRLGFICCGRHRVEELFGGRLHDILDFELLNPAYFPEVEASVRTAEEQQQPTGNDDVSVPKSGDNVAGGDASAGEGAVKRKRAGRARAGGKRSTAGGHAGNGEQPDIRKRRGRRIQTEVLPDGDTADDRPANGGRVARRKR